jgi:ribosomal protein S18 acetylase RimI-like enzyme
VPRTTVDLVTTEAQRDLAMTIWRRANRTRPRPAGDLRAARVRTKLDRAELLLLAHYGHRPAGMLLAETYLEEGVPDPEAGHLAMVFVDPAVWGSGVGAALVRYAQDLEWSRLSTWVRADNARAQRLLGTTGFTDTATRSALQDGDQIQQWTWHRG